MLQSIVIKNLALIGDAELNFGEGLNVLSGETGAGKSIIVDAIMLLLGAKYDKTLLRYGEASGLVEGVFDVTRSAREILAEMGHEAEDEVIVTRRFFDSGRNEIRVNGRVVTASMLRRLTERLVDIYGQHEYISVANIAEQGRLFDYYVRHNIGDMLESIGEKVAFLHKINEQLSQIGTNDDRERLIDILKFQIDEIENAHVKEGEEDELAAKRKVIASAEKINSALVAALNKLSEEELCALGLIEEAESSLNSISHIGEQYAALSERLKSVSAEVNDIAETVRDELDRDFDEADLDKIEERLDVLKKIRKKYGDYEHMTEFLNDSNERLYNLVNSDKLFGKLNSQKEEVLDEIYELSVKLSNTRKKLAKDFEREIEKHLGELGMGTVRFEIKFPPLPSRENCESYITPKGMDKPEFYFSPNRGQPLQPMTKIISGGEMSRFMLALKVVNGERDEMPTMIFDEIDVGISGNTGRAVAQKLQQIAKNHQVLCVTHLAQIAAMASNQYFIEKSVVDEQTFTKVTKLDRDGMINEIARLSGVGVSTQAYSAASELKQWCDDYKNSIR